LPNITTDIVQSCDSANQLLALPATQQGVQAGIGKVALSAAKLSTKVNAWCSLGVLAGPVLAQALSEVNTAGAGLLSTGVAAK
jgi:hypothetical protein